jgi:hypothetical protein
LLLDRLYLSAQVSALLVEGKLSCLLGYWRLKKVPKRPTSNAPIKEEKDSKKEKIIMSKDEIKDVPLEPSDEAAIEVLLGVSMCQNTLRQLKKCKLELELEMNALKSIATLSTVHAFNSLL